MVQGEEAEEGHVGDLLPGQRAGPQMGPEVGGQTLHHAVQIAFVWSRGGNVVI